MLKEYKYRDLFYDPDTHKDILIVPHRTQVIPREGRSPLLKSYDYEQKIFVTPNEKFPIKFKIGNDIIYKEKFEITESINSSDDLAFGSCEPAQVKFTIRNNKYKDDDTGLWEPDIPPLTKSEMLENGSFSSYQEIFKVYIYLNGDSSTMLYMGMFTTVEDKESNDGKTRDILGYDLLYTLRDIDISNWYRHLFGVGITTKTTDASESGYYNESDHEFYEDSQHTKKMEPDDKTTYLDLSTSNEYYCEFNSKGTSYTYKLISDDKALKGAVTIRPGRPAKNGPQYWTINEALHDLFENLIVLDDKKSNPELGEGDEEENGNADYPGFGLPLWFDETAFSTDNNVCPFPNLNKIKIVKNKNFIGQSLSLGKFLEDIGVLLGAYPKIKRGIPGDDGWCNALGGAIDIVTPIPNRSSAAKIDYTTHMVDYGILTFMALEEDKKYISKNHNPECIIKEYKILNGMKSESYRIPSINLIRMFNSTDKDPIKWHSGIPGNDKDVQNLIKAYNSNRVKKIQKAYDDLTGTISYVAITNYDVSNSIFFNHYGVKFSTKQKNSETSKSETVEDPDNIKMNKENKKIVGDVLKRAFANMKGRSYTPFNMQCIADLTRETGDHIRVIKQADDVLQENRIDFKSYILERKISGIQKMIDTYTAKGSNGLPNFGNYKSGSDYNSGSQGGASYVTNTGSSTTPDGDVTNEGIDYSNFVQIIRNIGIRLLDEPDVTVCTWNKKKKTVVMNWEDPKDITDYTPVPCEWAGTVVVRKAGAVPLHIWDDCDIIVDSTVRDQYKTTALVDNTIESGQDYYYGFFPYHVHLDDTGHPIKYYRFTKIMSVTTEELSVSPKLTDTTDEPTTRKAVRAANTRKTKVKLTCEAPETVDKVYVVAKVGSEPADEEDGRVIETTGGTTEVTFKKLNANSHYYFKAFTDDAESNEVEADTGEEPEEVFEYTGDIQTYTIPETGMYLLETWGAQGGSVTSEMHSVPANGGAGGYSRGEIFLEKDTVLYIGVGGQNGYNGGGIIPEKPAPPSGYFFKPDFSTDGHDGHDLVRYDPTKYCVYYTDSDGYLGSREYQIGSLHGNEILYNTYSTPDWYLEDNLLVTNYNSTFIWGFNDYEDPHPEYTNARIINNDTVVTIGMTIYLDENYMAYKSNIVFANDQSFNNTHYAFFIDDSYNHPGIFYIAGQYELYGYDGDISGVNTLPEYIEDTQTDLRCEVYLTNGYITNIKFYINNVLYQSFANYFSQYQEVPFFNVKNEDIDDGNEYVILSTDAQKIGNLSVSFT